MEGPGQGFPPARQSLALTDPLVRPTKWEEIPGRVAQLVEQRTENPCVAGSIPAPSTVWKWERLKRSIQARSARAGSRDPSPLRSGPGDMAVLAESVGEGVLLAR